MDTIEAIALFGILFTFLTTISGWIVTYSMQHTILKQQEKMEQDAILLKNKIEYQRDQKKIIISEGLEFLRELERWFESVRELYLKH